MLTLGHDPGKTGGFGVLDDDELVAVFSVPVFSIRVGSSVKELVDAVALSRKIKGYGTFDLAVIESVHAMPDQGVTSMFSFGRTLGVSEGVIGCLEIPTAYVTPQEWKKHFKLIKQEKDASRRLVCQMFPKISRKMMNKGDGGKAEACLIGLKGRINVLSARGRISANC